MIVLDKDTAKAYGEVSAPVGVYLPIEIKGDLFVLPDKALQSVKNKNLAYTKRVIAVSEWITIDE